MITPRFSPLRLLLPLLLTAVASAQETLIRKTLDVATDTHVEVVSLFSRPPGDGFLPVRVKIANNIPKSAAIHLNFVAGAGYNNNNKCVSNFEFVAAPGKTVTRDILVPLNPVSSTYGSYSNIRLKMTGTMGAEEGYINANYDSTQPSVLLSEPLFSTNASKLDTELTSKPGGPRYGGSINFASKFAAADLPDNWLAYAGFDSIIMLDSDWTSAPAGARSAIVSWMRLGGHLFIHSPANATAASLSLPENTGFGTLSLLPISSDHSMNAAETVMRVTTGKASDTRRKSLENDYQGGWPLLTAFGTKPFRYAVFIIILIVFGILVGPVNLFVFAKSGRRHRLFVTTPIISLGASLLLIVLIIFQDGFGGKGQRIVLMEVDENAAYLHQEQISRTGVLTKGSFGIDPASLIAPVQIPENPWARYTRSNNGGTFNLQPDSGKLIANGDWFQSRSEQGHAISSVIPTRGRIERTREADKLVSTFDFPIDKLFYRDPSGKWFRASSIATGQPFSLTPVEESLAEPEILDLGTNFASRNRDHFNEVRNRRGHFVAVTASGPVIATHPGIEWEKSTTLITGAVVTP